MNSERKIIKDSYKFTVDWINRNLDKGEHWLLNNIYGVVCNSLKPLIKLHEYRHGHLQRYLKPKYINLKFTGINLIKFDLTPDYTTDKFKSISKCYNEIIQELSDYIPITNAHTFETQLNQLKQFKF